LHIPWFEIIVITAPLTIWVAGIIAGEIIERTARWFMAPAPTKRLPCPFPKEV
jgi:hypothetical protein